MKPRLSLFSFSFLRSIFIHMNSDYNFLKTPASALLSRLLRPLALIVRLLDELLFVIRVCL